MTFLYAYLFVINVLTFVVFGWDKNLAISNKGRISEKALLWLGIIGGALGAFLAMKFFRHKTKKKSFLIRFGLVVVLQVLLMVFVLWG